MYSICPDCQSKFNGYKCVCGYAAVKPKNARYAQNNRVNSKYGLELKKDSMALLKLVMDKKVDTFTLSEKLWELEQKYPGVGFKEQSALLAKRALDPSVITPPPSNEIFRPSAPGHYCAWVGSNGSKCSKIGTSSGYTGEGIPYFCSEHS